MDTANNLFTETIVNGLSLKNRFIRSATWEGLATPEGAITPKLIDMMVSLAQGGVGLIIASHSYVSKEGQGTPWQIGIHEDGLVNGLKEMTSAVHENGGKILIQLAYAGQYTVTDLTKQAALAVSLPSPRPDFPCKEITQDDISSLIISYAQAAQRAKHAGFDGIQLHSAHGYLLSQFLSPAYNHRTDEYGGDIKNRTRIHSEILQAIREAVGRDYPVFIKMNCADFIENGLNADDSLQAATIFTDAGADAIEVSGGIIRTGKLSPSRPGITSQEKEAYFKEYAQKFKAASIIPLILVGGIKSFEVAAEVVSEGIADYISMSRALIREPDLIQRWNNGDLRPAQCTSDNLCFTPGFQGQGVYCVTKELEEKKISAVNIKNEYS
ncbi:2,4-dienoyl-CoA reductase [Candidatus Electrothrix aarhusensis]|uniref:2,4-dienoyl-CoA reductase n=1 Tax=Candidatus Electrothrix aarhusensis TaxID=1859131 RepID=A0A444J2P9_9BACT|nr:2,4-dienoyl-CoA reductase [Candidatus Electrothrix aarhusensis]